MFEGLAACGFKFLALFQAEESGGTVDKSVAFPILCGNTQHRLKAAGTANQHHAETE